MQSVQSLTLSATWTSGTINLVAYRVLATLAIPVANSTAEGDAIAIGMPILPPGVVPYMIFVPSTTTATSVVGSWVESHG